MGFIINPYAHGSVDPNNPGKTGLVAWWKVNEESGTRFDAHASFDLTDFNTTGFATGLIGNALNPIAANKEIVKRADAYTGEFESAADMSAMCWVKAANVEPLNTAFFIKYLDGTNNGWLLRTGVSTRHFNFTSKNSGGGINVSAVNLPSSTGWDFVVVGHDSTQVGNEMYISHNADAIVRTAFTQPAINTSSSRMAIGGTSHATLQFWNGPIDICAFWSRVLTEGEKTWLYNSGAGRDYSELA